MQQQYYLCFETALNEEEYELICKYWEFNVNEGKTKFTYAIKELTGILQHKNSGQVSPFVRGSCFIVSASVTGQCSRCKVKHTARVRNDFPKINRTKASICLECERKLVNAEALEKIQQINDINDKELDEVSFTFSELEELSYLNTLALLSIAFEINTVDEFPIPIDTEELNLSGCASVDENFLNGLYSKNAISVVGPSDCAYIDLLNELQYFLSVNRRLINRETLEMYDRCRSQITPPGIYCNIPSDFKGFDEYKDYLFSKIGNAKICLNEVELIRELVINIRLNQAYRLLSIIKNYWNIPLPANNKLDMVLRKVLEKYPLLVVHNILNYQGKELAAVIQSQKTTSKSYFLDKLYPKKVEEHMMWLDRSDKEPYIRNLPDSMVSSKIEDFTSYHILGGLISWTELSVDEIIDKWANSPTIEILF